MFKEETVFILGAGASWHYGCPTGEDLITLIQQKAGELITYWQGAGAQDGTKNNPPNYFREYDASDFEEARQSFLKDCNAIKKKLRQVNPLVIDYFLHYNQSLRKIGKLLISYVLLDCERQFKDHQGNQNRIKNLKESHDLDEQEKAKKFDVKKIKTDDWCKFILEMMLSECQNSEDSKINLVSNQISFVTFNYDVTLENRIFKAIDQTEFITQEQKDEFYKNRVFHVYGQIREGAFENTHFGSFPNLENTSQSYEIYKDALDKAWESAQLIYTIPEEKASNEKILEVAKTKIRSAKKVFILGYGFDQENNKKIGISSFLNADNAFHKKVYFTNFLDSNRINKRMGIMCANAEDKFINKLIYQTVTKTGSINHFEKSIKDVYGALASDFDMF